MTPSTSKLATRRPEESTLRAEHGMLHNKNIQCPSSNPEVSNLNTLEGQNVKLRQSSGPTLITAGKYGTKQAKQNTIQTCGC